MPTININSFPCSTAIIVVYLLFNPICPFSMRENLISSPARPPFFPIPFPTRRIIPVYIYPSVRTNIEPLMHTHQPHYHYHFPHLLALFLYLLLLLSSLFAIAVYLFYLKLLIGSTRICLPAPKHPNSPKPEAPSPPKTIYICVSVSEQCRIQSTSEMPTYRSRIRTCPRI